MRRFYKLAVQKHSVINLCGITGFGFESHFLVLVYSYYFSLFNHLYLTMSLTDRFRDPHADVVSALNISLCFAALIITLFIIIRVGNKTYNNKKPQQCWNWALSAVRHECNFMQNCVIRLSGSLPGLSILAFSVSVVVFIRSCLFSLYE